MTDRFMMATRATHRLGDISRDVPELAAIYGEEGGDWIGAWVEGFGFANVRFPKATTRELTDAERQLYAGRFVSLAGNLSPTGVTVDKDTAAEAS